jgi:hypothetical protein
MSFRPKIRGSEIIPGLRKSREEKRSQGPPEWADWIHKFGPLVTAIVSAIIFFLTLKFTIEPIYRRALLEEANAKMEISLRSADASLERSISDSISAKKKLAAVEAQQMNVEDKLTESRLAEQALKRGLSDIAASNELLNASNSKYRAEAVSIALELADKKSQLVEADVRLRNETQNLALISARTTLTIEFDFDSCTTELLDNSFDPEKTLNKNLLRYCMEGFVQNNKKSLEKLPNELYSKALGLARDIDKKSENQIVLHVDKIEKVRSLGIIKSAESVIKTQEKIYRLLANNRKELASRLN